MCLDRWVFSDLITWTYVPAAGEQITRQQSGRATESYTYYRLLLLIKEAGAEMDHKAHTFQANAFERFQTYLINFVVWCLGSKQSRKVSCWAGTWAYEKMKRVLALKTKEVCILQKRFLYNLNYFQQYLRKPAGSQHKQNNCMKFKHQLTFFLTEMSLVSDEDHPVRARESKC